MNVVLAAASDPFARKHLERTIIDGVEIDEIGSYLKPEVIERVREIDTKARIWGLVKGRNNDIYWEKLVEDDVILFNVGTSYVVYSRVLGKEINTELAKHLWEPSPRTGYYYDKIIFLKDIQQIDVSISKINQLLGYSPGFKPSRNVSFIVVQKQRIEKAISTQDTLERAIGIERAPGSVANQCFWVFYNRDVEECEKRIASLYYPFHSDCTNYKRLVSNWKKGDKALFYCPNSFRAEFDMESVEEVPLDELDKEEYKTWVKENRKVYRAILSNPKRFEPPIEITPEIKVNLLGTGGTFYGRSLLPITEGLYKKIVRSSGEYASGKLHLSSEAEKFIEKFKRDPENQAWLQRKIKAFEKWRLAFSTENIEKLSRGEFQSFLTFKENQSWDGIQRQPSVYANMDKLKKTVEYLIDGIDDLSLEEIRKKLDNILDPDGEFKISGLDRAVVTGIMHICDTKNRLGVWNNKVDASLEKLGLLAQRPTGSRGEQYLVYNNVLNLLGRQYDLSLYQVDMLMHLVATQFPSERLFAFTSKDFESCTGKKGDARYLSERFSVLLEVLKSSLGDEFASFKNYSARPNEQPKRGQKEAQYKDHMWLGFAHPMFERAQKGIQFQVSINSDDPFCIDIWIDRRSFDSRKMAKENIEKNKEAFKELIQRLVGYNAGLYEGYKFDRMTTELVSNTFDEFLTHMVDYDTHVHIGKILTKEEVLTAGSKIIDTIVGTFKELHPIYSLLVGKPISPSMKSIPRVEKVPSIPEIVSYIESKGFYYPEETIRNYHASLETKPFVILSGITGTGKTKLSELYANAFYHIDAENPYFRIISVQPNWNDKKPLLGYYNPIMDVYYKTPFLDFLLMALKDCQDCSSHSDGKCKDKHKCTRRYFVCLDEMNLAHVEYYFADFLSAMESKRPMDLHSSEVKTEDGGKIGRNITIPHNLYIIGTVNIDETTKEFSPKVRDRANTILLEGVNLDRWLDVQRKIGRSVNMSAFKVVKDINGILEKHRMHFGYRICDEILRYVETGELQLERALDLQIKQKILPKLCGDANARLRGSLQNLKDYLEHTQFSDSTIKVTKMLENLDQQGFTSFFD